MQLSCLVLNFHNKHAVTCVKMPAEVFCMNGVPLQQASTESVALWVGVVARLRQSGVFVDSLLELVIR